MSTSKAFILAFCSPALLAIVTIVATPIMNRHVSATRNDRSNSTPRAVCPVAMATESRNLLTRGQVQTFRVETRWNPPTMSFAPTLCEHWIPVEEMVHRQVLTVAPA